MSFRALSSRVIFCIELFIRESYYFFHISRGLWEKNEGKKLPGNYLHNDHFFPIINALTAYLNPTNERPGCHQDAPEEVSSLLTTTKGDIMLKKKRAYTNKKCVKAEVG